MGRTGLEANISVCICTGSIMRPDSGNSPQNIDSHSTQAISTNIPARQVAKGLKKPEGHSTLRAGQHPRHASSYCTASSTATPKFIGSTRDKV